MEVFSGTLELSGSIGLRNGSPGSAVGALRGLVSGGAEPPDGEAAAGTSAAGPIVSTVEGTATGAVGTTTVEGVGVGQGAAGIGAGAM
jgi:hypothetical protein